EIGAEYIPHYHLEFPTKNIRLFDRDPSVRRPEEITLRELMATENTFRVSNERSIPTVEVFVGVVSDRMSFCPDPIEYPRIPFHVPPDTEERCPCLMLGKLIQHPRSYLRYRSVIESEINR